MLLVLFSPIDSWFEVSLSLSSPRLGSSPSSSLFESSKMEVCVSGKLDSNRLQTIDDFMKHRSVSKSSRNESLWRPVCLIGVSSILLRRRRCSVAFLRWLRRKKFDPRLDACTLIAGRSYTWWHRVTSSPTGFTLVGFYGLKMFFSLGLVWVFSLYFFACSMGFFLCFF